MEFSWFLIFNLDEFLATELVTRRLTYNLSGIGGREFLISRGNEVSVTVDDSFLVINFNENNPWVNEGKAIWHDEVTGNVYVGFPQ